MLRILQSLLVLITLVLMAFVAVKANSAPLAEGENQWQPPVANPVAVFPHRSSCRRLVPGPQAGTHLQAQPFAYGYFGAHAPTSAAFHSGNRKDWYQWTFTRAD